MKGLALTGLYALSIGMLITGLETGRIPEEWAGFLYLTWATAGLILVVLGVVIQRD